MLRNARELENFVVQATDGELGTVDQLYFDDETWAIRYLTVELGWLGTRRVLISPISVIHADWIGRRLDVALTKRQVENSPDIDTDKPVSRQHEIQRVLRISVLLGWPLPVGPSVLPGRRKNCSQGRGSRPDTGQAAGFSSAQYQSRHWLSY